MNKINFLTSFLAGIFSFLSPCVLPLVPGYISFISGLSLEDLKRQNQNSPNSQRVLLSSLAFVIGFSVVFTLMGASASAIGKFLLDWISVVSKVAGTIIILFGFHLIGIFPIPWLYYERRFQWGSFSSQHLGPFLMGLAFAFGWTPCIGPILAGILALAATQETVFKGSLLLFTYSLGLGMPFILTAWSINKFLTFFNRYKKFIRQGEIFAGVLLIFIGGLIFSNKLSWLLQWAPHWLFKFAL